MKTGVVGCGMIGPTAAFALVMHDDPFLVLADYPAYVKCQDRVTRGGETRMDAVNVAEARCNGMAGSCECSWSGTPNDRDA